MPGVVLHTTQDSMLEFRLDSVFNQTQINYHSLSLQQPHCISGVFSCTHVNLLCIALFLFRTFVASPLYNCTLIVTNIPSLCREFFEIGHSTHFVCHTVDFNNQTSGLPDAPPSWRSRALRSIGWILAR
jgi:hypothetical protein